MQVYNVVLDIDNTLLHAIKKDLQLTFKHVNLKSFEIDSHVVFLRPKVEEFLEFLFANFRVGVFTAAGSLYAEQIIRKLFKKKPHFVFTTVDYDLCRIETSRFKDLNWVEQKIPFFRRDHTLIVDDAKVVKLSNDDHCFNIRPFFVMHEIRDQIGMIQFNNLSSEEKQKHFLADCVLDTELQTCMDFILQN
jgi:TFIIF-interacting CTD phosphatase-like protein